MRGHLGTRQERTEGLDRQLVQRHVRGAGNLRVRIVAKDHKERELVDLSRRERALCREQTYVASRFSSPEQID